MAREELPYIALYVGDWRKDPGVQSLSYHHRGIWIELLMHMHCSEHRGRLVLNGKAMSNAAIARLLGLSEREATDAISVLLDAGVPSRDESGALYSRRMVRENEIAAIRKQNGSKGGSKTQANHQAKLKQNPDNDIGNDNDNGSYALSDEEWLEELQSQENYSNLNVKQLHLDMMTWCKNNNKMPTRRRFVNWLNRQDRPMDGHHQPANTLMKPISVWEINEKIKAIDDELGRTQWKKEEPTVAERRRQLFARKKELQRKLTE